MSAKRSSRFGSVFDPSLQPGFAARYSQNVNDTQLGKIFPDKEPVDLSGFSKNPRKDFNSRQVKEVNPTAWLRKKYGKE